MIAVADASPICHLILIGHIDLLPELFNQILLPREVVGELLDESAPAAVRAWAAAPPAWASIHDAPGDVPAGLERLHAGERAAILLAESMGADLILLDEKSARHAAERRGLRVTGLLGVLAEAASRGRIDLPGAIDRLARTGFRSSPALLKSLLDRSSKT